MSLGNQEWGFTIIADAAKLMTLQISGLEGA